MRAPSFVLDTNVLSAVLLPSPPQRVADWLRRQPTPSLYTTCVNQAEILAGLQIMQIGKRRTALLAAVEAIFERDFEGRVLPFDARAAPMYAAIFAMRRRAGLATPESDLMIAAIARAHGAAVVTRNTRDFDQCDVPLVNPWED